MSELTVADMFYGAAGSSQGAVAQLGNAVTPPVMRLLTGRVLESLR